MKFFLIFLLCLILDRGVSQDFSHYRIPCEKTVYYINYFFIENYKYPPNTSHNAGFLPVFTSALNTLFKPACIEFKVCKVDTIKDYNYFRLQDETKTNEYVDVLLAYYKPHMINVYWASDYIYTTEFGICESYKNKPSIFIASDQPTPDNLTSYLKQFMIFFGMKNTMSTPSSSEWVDGINGKVTADSTWDTPADPYGLTYNSTDTVYSFPTIEYYYTNKKDANGDYYNPMIYNIMCSIFTYGKCWQLTHEQYQQLIINNRRCRKTWWGF